MENDTTNTDTATADVVIEDGGLIVTVTDSFGQTGGNDEDGSGDDESGN